ncbi:MAG TPA: metalloregulator ArsR/SmtB family transcription factor [Acidobacteriota bacterium]|nr:metalloregulator ArsR/SmtB family transcription factor [Acidobacteriota bacterium]
MAKRAQAAADKPAPQSAEPAFRELGEFFAALADPSRLGMLALLQRHGEMCVCEIQRVLGVTQSRASRHLQTLRRAGLVQDRRVGAWVHYRIDDRPGPRQRRLLDLLPALTDAAAVADIDRKLAARRRETGAVPCPAPKRAAKKGASR